MKFYDTYQYEVNTNLNQSEEILKELYLQYPERNLELPHKTEYIEDILQQAASKSTEFFPIILTCKHILKEDSFFRGELDTEIYQHLRYLPCNWHAHTFLEVICVIQGSCINYIGEQTLEMKSGDVCIIAPNTTHAISAFSDDSMIFNIILRTSTFETAFFGTLSDNDVLSDFFMRALYNSKSHPYLLFRTGNDQELFNYIGYAYSEFIGNRQYKNRMLNSIINAFFIVLLRNHGANVVIPSLDMTGGDQNLLYILKYMQEHYATISLKELSVFFNYSERQLQRIIKSSTGMSFSENIQKLKMRHAARLLSNPEISISAVSEELGYSDTGNFRHVFKKFYGMTPMEFRK